MHDNFAVIRWGAAGIGPGTAGLLWSVPAEVVVFLFVGRPLLDRLGPAGAAMLVAAAGIVRWMIMAETSWLPAEAARPRDRDAVRGTEGEIYRGAQAVVATERKVPEGNFFASRRRS